MVTLAFGTIVQILINEMTFLTEGPMGITLTSPAVRPAARRDASSTGSSRCCCRSLVVVHRVLRSHLGRAFEALRGSPVASRLHGRLGVPLQGLRVRDQRRLAGLAARCTRTPSSTSRRTRTTSS
jgi:ABC-type branched-subunit amino acid transport system permease subunit